MRGGGSTTLWCTLTAFHRQASSPSARRPGGWSAWTDREGAGVRPMLCRCGVHPGNTSCLRNLWVTNAHTTWRAFLQTLAVPLCLFVPHSAPHARGYAAIHASREQQRQQAQCQQGSPATAPQQPVVPTHHERSVTPLEHKFLQVHFSTCMYSRYQRRGLQLQPTTDPRQHPASCS